MQIPATDIKCTLTEKDIWQLLESVSDPEVPVLSVIDLGIIRNVVLLPGKEGQLQQVEITITPTYSGCPAMDAITMDIRLKLAEHGLPQVLIKKLLSPAWTTDWMTQAGKEKLKGYGIAPPQDVPQLCDSKLFAELASVQCPLCNSYHTQLISHFGSTACKALYQCQDCKEPFDYFKCH